MSAATEKQKADLLRKMRARMRGLNVSSESCLSRVDYDQMGIKLSVISEMNERQAENMRKEFFRVAELIGLKPGVKNPNEEELQRATESLLAMAIEEQKLALVACGMMYDLIDTDGDGHISLLEFKAFLQVLGSGITDEKASRCFNILDFNGNGVISRDEFLISSHEFMQNLEKTANPNKFFGDLVG